jgi:hypothetical protein
VAAAPLGGGLLQLKGVNAEGRLTQVGSCGGQVARGLTELTQTYIVHLAQLGAKFVNVKNCLDG